MQNEQPWYIDQRADALAMVHLTVRSDLHIEGPRRDQFPDFQVWLREDNRDMLRIFGVEVESQDGPLSETEWQRMFERAKQQARLRKVGYPLCLFLIDTITDEVRYAWLVAPVADAGRGALLQLAAGSDLKRVTRKAIDEIVEAVARFYDTLFVPVAA